MTKNKKWPDQDGRFGIFGGKYVAETLMPALDELETAYKKIAQSKSFQKEFKSLLKDYVGRPTPLYFAKNLTDHFKGPKIFLKREDLCHTGAHKVNNTLGQVLLAKAMGKKRIIAETGAGQHGVATATMCALLGLQCEVYMGEEDVERQALNVYRMKLLGAKVIPVTSGTKTLKDALNEALRDWITNIKTTYYCIGTVAGPHPYPMIVRDFQSVIGQEVRKQIKTAIGRLPNAIVACVGGGSNAMGIFYPFIQDENVKLIGVEAAGDGLTTMRHAATLVKGQVGVLHGAKSYVLQNEDGQIQGTHSISAGLDYPGVGPEHAYLKDIHRAEFVAVNDQEAMAGFNLLTLKEGILPALESSHAIAYLKKLCKKMKSSEAVVVNLSGRGDKDMGTISDYYNVPLK